MNNTEFNRSAAGVATNIQKLVQNVSSMQRMLVHVDTQGDSIRSGHEESSYEVVLKIFD